MFMTKTKTHSDNKVDLKKKTYVELQELLRRQNAILNNKYLIIHLNSVTWHKIIDYQHFFLINVYLENSLMNYLTKVRK